MEQSLTQNTYLQTIPDLLLMIEYLKGYSRAGALEHFAGIAKRKFVGYFVDEIQQVLFSNPADSKDKSG